MLGAFVAGGLRRNDVFETNSFRAFFGSGAGGALSAGSQAALIFTFGYGFNPQAIVFSVMIGIVGGAIGFMMSIAWGIAGLWVELARDRLRQHHPGL